MAESEMTDIIERLRNPMFEEEGGQLEIMSYPENAEVMMQAADMIESLRSTAARAREEALEEAARLAEREAFNLEGASYAMGKLPEHFADVNKWRYIASAIRSLKNQKPKWVIHAYDRKRG